MKNRRLYMLIAVVGLLLMWSYCGTEVQKDPGTAHLLDRPWVNKLPKDPRQPHHAMVFLSRDNVGAIVNGSAYQHLVTVFRHKTKGNQVTVEILQANKKFTTLVKTYKCRGPDGLDLCLDLGPRVKQLRFYSSTKWKLPRQEGTPSFGLDGIIDAVAIDQPTTMSKVDVSEGLRLFAD